MLIRSQDKMSIINFDNIDTIWAKTDEDKGIEEHYETSIQYFCGGEETMGTLGFYSTEEKAIKVLDMIQDAYARCESTRTLSNGTMVDLAGKFNKKQSDDFINDHRATFVFQMPQDEEV